MYLKRKLEKNPATNMTLKFASVWDKVLNFNLETTVKANCFTIMLKFIFWSCFYDSVWFLNSQDKKKNGPKRNALFHFAYNTEILLGKVIVLFNFSNRRRKRSCPLKLGRMGVQVSIVGLNMLSFLIFNRWKLLPVTESATLLTHRNMY